MRARPEGAVAGWVGCQETEREPRWQCLRKERAFLESEHTARDAAQETTREQGERPLLCRQCHAEITSHDEAIEVEHAHRHTFFNPAGMLYSISCFARAPGCQVVGQESEYFAWFDGCSWRVTVCGSCHLHLGWFFSGGGSTDFFGLIIDRLVEE